MVGSTPSVFTLHTVSNLYTVLPPHAGKVLRRCPALLIVHDFKAELCSKMSLPGTHIGQQLVHVLLAVRQQLIQRVGARHVDLRRRRPEVVQADLVRHVRRDVRQLQPWRNQLSAGAARLHRASCNRCHSSQFLEGLPILNALLQCPRHHQAVMHLLLQVGVVDVAALLCSGGLPPPPLRHASPERQRLHHGRDFHQSASLGHLSTTSCKQLAVWLEMPSASSLPSQGPDRSRRCRPGRSHPPLSPLHPLARLHRRLRRRTGHPAQRVHRRHLCGTMNLSQLG